MMVAPRENLLKVFRHEAPEWIPVVGHVDPYNRPDREGMDPKLAEALGEVKWCDESTVAFSRYLGIDIMDFFSPPLRSVRKNVAVERVEEGDTTTNIWHTPHGHLREVIRICRTGGTVSSNWVEHPVKGPEDLPAFASIFEDEESEVDAEGLEKVKRRRSLIGDGGMMMFFMAGTPLGMMYRMYSGIETLAYLWADARDALHDLFQVMEQNYLRRYALAAKTDVDALVGMDDTSTTAISPAMFEESNMELTDARARAAHDAGNLYFHHSCGLIRDLLPLYRQTQMDAVHAFTIPPVGDVTVEEGRKLLGDRITIIAGLGQLAGSMADRDAVRASIRGMFEGAGPGDHFILGLAAYPDKTMEQTRFIVEECRKHQGLSSRYAQGGT